MQEIVQNNHSWARMVPTDCQLGKLIGWSLLSGVAATMVMDCILIGVFLASGLPPFTCFSMIGDTILAIFPSLHLADSVPLGVGAHYLIGPLLGACFGAAQRTITIPAWHVTSLKKAIILAVFYAEIVSQPLLALTPLFLQMTTSEILLWFGGSFGMHFIWGCAFGAVWSMRILPAKAGRK